MREKEILRYLGCSKILILFIKLNKSEHACKMLCYIQSDSGELENGEKKTINKYLAEFIIYHIDLSYILII